MGRKIVFLNILMLVTLVVVAQHLIGSWRDFEQGQGPIQPVGPPVQLQETSLPERLASISLFLDIGAGNLFSEQRGQNPNEGLEAEAEGEAPPELSPEPKLTSLMTFGEEKTAVLSIAAKRRSRSPAEVIRVKLGDDVQGYTVAEIEDDRIVLSWREHRREIFLEPEQAEPRKTAARAEGGPKIIVVGAPAAAVETTTLASAAEQGRGVQVGTVGQAGQGAGRTGGLGGGGRGLAGGRGSAGSGGRGGGLGGGGTRGSGILGAGGLGSGSGSRGQPTQQRRPPGD